MKLLIKAVFSASFFISIAMPAQTTNHPFMPDPARLKIIDQILRQVPLIDGHNDLAWQFRELCTNNLDGIDLSINNSKHSNNQYHHHLQLVFNTNICNNNISKCYPLLVNVIAAILHCQPDFNYQVPVTVLLILISAIMVLLRLMIS